MKFQLLKKYLLKAVPHPGKADSTQNLRGLLIGFGLVALLVAAISTYGVLSSIVIKKEFDEIVDEVNQRIALLRQLELLSQKRTRLSFEIIHSIDTFDQDEKIQEQSAAASLFILSFSALRDMPQESEEQKQLDELGKLGFESQKQLKKTINLVVSDQRDAAIRQLLTHGFIAHANVLAKISNLIAFYQTEVANIHNRALIKSQQQQRVLVIGGGLAFLLTLVIGWRVWGLMRGLMNGLHHKQLALEDSLRTMGFQQTAMDEHAIISITDPAGRILSVNKKFTEISQYSAAELIGQDHRILNSAYHPHEFFVTLWKIIASGKVWHGNIRNVRKDGSYYWVSSTIVPFLNESGRPYQYVSMRTDITPLIEAEQMLGDQANHSRAIMDNMSGGVITIDEYGSIRSFNIAAVAMFGYSREETLGRNVSMLMPQPQRDAHNDYIHTYQTSGVTHVIGTHRVMEGRRKDGSLFPIDLVISEITHNKRPTYVGLIQDITEHKRAEAALIAARDEATLANAAKSNFLSSMSHELRTPMNAILGFGQLMSFDPALSEENKDYVGEILKAGDHLLKLINEVLDLTKIESGKLELSIGPVDLCDIVEECLDLVATLADKRSVQISHNKLAGVVVRADSTRLKQALLNLLANAIKYNRTGGSVTLSVVQQGTERLRILVTDTGPGIPAERMQELFKPFSRLGAENGVIEGTGIGLTITRRIVEMMDGQVGVTSEVGVGSTFWIELPLDAMHESDPESKSTAKHGATSSLPQVDDKKYLVLYIEDNPSNIRLVEQLLARQKHIRLLSAHTPALGIELARTHIPELILLDINLPDMDGYQVLEVLRGDAALKAIPVIAVSANAMQRDIERGMAAGFNDYLIKPLNVAHFFATVDKILQQARSDHESP